MSTRFLVVVGGLVLLVSAVSWWAFSTFRTVRIDESLPRVEPNSGQGASPLLEEMPGRDMARSETEPQDSVSPPPSVSSEAQPVIGTTGHPASGTAKIVSSGEAMFLRYENFKTLNGPDLFVYLSKDISATDFVDLGPLRATEGNINYEIPDTVDPRKYPYALVWCKAFGVLFNSAKLY